MADRLVKVVNDVINAREKVSTTIHLTCIYNFSHGWVIKVSLIMVQLLFHLDY